MTEEDQSLVSSACAIVGKSSEVSSTMIALAQFSGQAFGPHPTRTVDDERHAFLRDNPHCNIQLMDTTSPSRPWIAWACLRQKLRERIWTRPMLKIPESKSRFGEV